MTDTVEVLKFAFRAYKMLGICVNILCVFSLENESVIIIIIIIIIIINCG
jgi:hypothetical protein